MSANNPFASFNIEMPKKYQDSVKKYCRTAGTDEKRYEFVPFERQVDFWFMAFLIAVHKRLDPIDEKDNYTATAAHILGSDPKRISFMQLSVLGLTQKFEILANDRSVFEYCLKLANAGIPYLLEILNNSDGTPLWSLLDELDILTQS
ncbi:hypothetical protein WDW89_20670 [Deltaproteobacteria bacterium TL4]